MEDLTTVGLTNPVLLAVAVEVIFLFTMSLYREGLKDNAPLMDRWNDLASILALLFWAAALSLVGQAATGPLDFVTVGDALLRGLGVAGTLAIGYKLIKGLRYDGPAASL